MGYVWGGQPSQPSPPPPFEQGKYAFISSPAKDYIMGRVKDDNAVYAAGVEKHMEQRRRFPKFDEHLERFKHTALLLKNGEKDISSLPGDAHAGSRPRTRARSRARASRARRLR